jgi:uracil-DNA glycosylase family 4
MRSTPRYSKPPTCVDCVLATAGRGFAPFTYPRGASILLVGEALGEDEVSKGENFVGAAGGTLSRILHRAGIDRATLGIANCLSCQPPGNYLDGAAYEYAALAHCRPNLQAALDHHPAVIVPLGGVALRTILNLHGVPGVAVKDFHGTVSRDPTDQAWVLPTFHPSHLQRGAMNLLDVVTTDLQKAQRIAQHGFTRSPATLVVDPHPVWFEQWVDRHLTALAADPDHTWLAVDTEFPETIAGRDEDAITQVSDLIRVNVANRIDEGVTVPYTGPYIPLLERLLAAGGTTFLWFKHVDLDKLREAGHTLNGEYLDAAVLCHYLQTDLPMSLGFWAPIYSDFGAWKHWSKQPETQGPYAAADALQTYRIAVGAVGDAMAAGLWEVFLRDWHDREQYVLRPAMAIGLQIDRVALEAFHQDLQGKLTRILTSLKTTAAQGVLKPKQGYAKKPTGPCPVSILGDAKSATDAKHQYMLSEVQLVERTIEVDLVCCTTCGKEGVTATHRCPKVKGPKTIKGEAPPPPPPARTPVLVTSRRAAVRYFWQLPFNPDAPAQVLAYLTQQGQQAPIDRKTRNPTTNKKALKDLASKTGDPFYQLQLDWKAVQKVDSTYAVATLGRLDPTNRLHAEITPRPSTLRDSCINPNLQNVVADKGNEGGTPGLASGFRECVVAGQAWPAWLTEEAYVAWEARYAQR